MKLPESLRDALKEPLGMLLAEDVADEPHIRRHVGPDPFVIAVGDMTTEKLIGFGLVPCLQIIDSVERRARREAPRLAPGTREIFADNPPGEITEESIRAIREALAMTPPVRLVITGEEDLLVIPACIHAPDNAVVLYGQPGEGLVIVRVTPEIRNKTRAILESME